MPTVPAELLNVILPFAPFFSKPVFQHVQLLITGAILSPGKRTVTQALRVMGRSDDAHFQNYHRVLNRCRWSALALSHVLLLLLVDRFVPEGEIVLGLDDTIERRKGKRISALGVYRDAVRSSHSHFVKATGLRWLSTMLTCPIKQAGGEARVWALPFLTVLSASERYYEARRVEARKLTDRARQMILLVARWLRGREIVVAADSGFAALELLDAVRSRVTVVTRLRMDAAIYERLPQTDRRKVGRPRKAGRRLPTPEEMAADPKTRWRRLKVALWYGERDRIVEVASGECVWYHRGKPPVPIRYVIVRDPQKKGDKRRKQGFKTQALLSTKVEARTEQILGWFIRRWQMEVTCEESRAHMGVETSRQWTDRAIARTTPALLGLYSVVVLLAERLLIKQGELPVRGAAWYRKESATFSDIIAFVRRYLWSCQNFETSEKQADVIKIPRSLFDRLTDTLCYAA